MSWENKTNRKRGPHLFICGFALLFLLACQKNPLEGLFLDSDANSAFAEFKISNQTVIEGPSLSTQIEIDLSQPAPAGTSIDLLIGGTASPSDHNLSNQSTLNIPEGKDSILVVLLVNDNLLLDGDRTVTVTLANANKINLGSKTIHTVNIQDNENFNPQNLTSTANSDKAITLDWDISSTGAEAGYRIAYMTGALPPLDCSTGTVIPEGSITGTTHQVTGLLESTLYSFRVCGIDTDSPANASTGVTIAETTLVKPITLIYRSIGPGKTTVVDDNNSGTVSLTISAPTATFSAAIANNVGLGDVLVYDQSGTRKYAFISGRTSSTVFTVLQADGISLPVDISADTTWQIFRAYTSLSNAESGIENTGITGTPDFDSWTGGRDLVTNNEQWNITLFADANDNSNANITGWTTDLEHYLRIFSPQWPSQVGASQRHTGLLNTGYRLNGQLSVTNSNVAIEGLTVRYTRTTGDYGGVSFYTSGDNEGLWTLKDSIIYVTDQVGTNTCGIYLGGATTNINSNIVNNIVYYDGTDGDAAIFINSSTLSGIRTNIYNNTFVGRNGRRSIRKNAGNIYIKNSIFDGPISDWGGGGDMELDNSLLTASTTSGWTLRNTKLSQAIEYNKLDLFDYRVSGRFYNAIGTGMDLSADSEYAFSDDYTGNTRTRWDIGASLIATAIYRSVGPGNTSSLQNGSGNDLTISVNSDGHTLATFASALPANVGLGDIIQYDADNSGGVDSVGVISQVIDTQNVILKSPLGANATVTTAASQSWDIFRAHTSLFNAEQGTVNSGISAGLQSQIIGGNRNIAANYEQWTFVCYGDALDTVPVTIESWETNNNFYISVIAAQAERHMGYWNNSSYTLSGTGKMIDVRESAVIEGLQAELTAAGATTTALTALVVIRPGNGQDVIWKDSIIRSTSVNTNNYGMTVGVNTFGSRVYNNIVYGFDTTGSRAVFTDNIGSNGQPGLVISNNTIVKNYIGIARSSANNYHADKYFNNLVVGNSSVDIQNAGPTSYPDACSDNATTDTSAQTFCDTSRGNNTYKTGVVATDMFIDYANNDFRLVTGVVVIDAGKDLLNTIDDFFDNVGNLRTTDTAWDIGAYEFNVP